MGLAMDADWYLDHYAEPPKRFSRRRKMVTQVTQRPRWRITLDELCYVANINPATFQKWAEDGLLGGRLQSLPSQGGRGRHITRVTAQRTVLTARLVHAGLSPEAAAHVAAGHKVGDTTPLRAELSSGVTVIISRHDLP